MNLSNYYYLSKKKKKRIKKDNSVEKRDKKKQFTQSKSKQFTHEKKVRMFVWMDMCFWALKSLSQRGRVGRVIMCTRLKTDVEQRLHLIKE